MGDKMWLQKLKQKILKRKEEGSKKQLHEEIKVLYKRLERLELSEVERHKAEKALAEAYNELRQIQQLLIQAEKMQTVGVLVSGIAHEVKNPLGIIIQGVDYLERKISPDNKHTSSVLEMIKDSVKKADNIIASLFDFTRLEHFSLQPENLNLILEDTLLLIKQRLKFEHIEIIKELQPDMSKALVDKNKIEQVFINVLLNAIQAIQDRGTISIRSYDTQSKSIKDYPNKIGEERFRPGERVVVVEIEDTGVGISKEDLKKIFDPFFTTKRPGKGIGLGLPVSQSIVNMHNGLIQVKSELGKGTKVLIFLDIAT